MVAPLLISLFLSLCVSALSWRWRLLTLGGGIAATVVGTLVFGFGQFQWAVPLLLFFVSSNLLSRIQKPPEVQLISEKGDMRDAWQVLANGGVGIPLVLFSLIDPDDAVYACYSSSIAAVTADTWATEIGTVAKGHTISLATLRRVPPGTSGGVSLLGSVGGVAGAVAVGFCAAAWTAHSLFEAVWVVSTAGCFGGVADSVLGGTLQARYACERCGRIVERKEHCGSATIHSGGLRWLTNDWVNLACSLSGGIAGWILWKLAA